MIQSGGEIGVLLPLSDRKIRTEPTSFGRTRISFGVVVVAKTPRPFLSSRILGFIAFIGGLVIGAVSLLADTLGVSGGGEGLGWKQLIGAIFGGAIALLGLGSLFRSGHEPGDA